MLLPVLLGVLSVTTPAAPETLSASTAERFASLALACVHREYPNKVAHVLKRDGDARPPRQLTPAFYGCYDWHSAVHGHWLLARLARTFPDAPWAPKARAALARSLTPAHIARETQYLRGEGRASFERPYGLAWLLQLATELHAWDDPQARRWAKALEPLEREVAVRLQQWLPKLSHPVRTGEHSQSAFALGLVLDWARARGETEMAQLVLARARAYYGGDAACPLGYEPGGEDFLSPCLAEADLMRRVLAPEEYGPWLARFLPADGDGAKDTWLAPAVATDRTDGKLAHLDGLNLSRAWMLEGILHGLPEGDARRAHFARAAAAHARAGLASVTGEHYEGGHWLGSFAVYLVTRRGLVP
ncbi:MAG: DUF2891 domain-containing protein [Myxococcaceae bacterium]|nr:DUF2891 domain-containing protein [Myxococcaceae bacterium]MCI0669858.1 DUF2891 domain-containing protein [Myxococcaceae bacterium]